MSESSFPKPAAKWLAVAMLAVSAQPLLALSELQVYTYSSFTSEWGPGPQIEQRFEEICECELKFQSFADGVALLTRLKLEGPNSPADVVLGLDSNLIEEARESGLIAEHGLDLPALAFDWAEPLFIPYDWGYFAFVYRKDELQEAPGSLDDLLNLSERSIVLQDPRSSTPGLGFLLWVKKQKGSEAQAFLEKLAPKILTITPGWSEAYSLFVGKEAPVVLSYTTSPAYHEEIEEDSNYAAALFEGGHYGQIEIAGLLKASQNKDLGRRFLAYLLEEQSQSLFAHTNWMYPVVEGVTGLPDAFVDLVQPEHFLLFKPEEVAQNRDVWTKEFLEALSQ